MRILEISVKASVKRNTSTALYPALIQIVSWIVVDPLLSVFKVKIICVMYFIMDPFLIRNLLFKIAHVISIVQTVVLIVQIQFVSVVKIRRLKIKIISRLVRWIRVLTQDSASQTVKTIKLVKPHVSIVSKQNMKNAHVR